MIYVPGNEISTCQIWDCVIPIHVESKLLGFLENASNTNAGKPMPSIKKDKPSKGNPMPSTKKKK